MKLKILTAIAAITVIGLSGCSELNYQQSDFPETESCSKGQVVSRLLHLNRTTVDVQERLDAVNSQTQRDFRWGNKADYSAEARKHFKSSLEQYEKAYTDLEKCF